MKQFISLILLSCLLSSVLNGQGNMPNSEGFIDILESELQREFDVLKTQTPPVHYMDYRVEDSKTWNVNAFMGSVNFYDSTQYSYVNNFVRVGTPDFDNTHPIKGKRNSMSGSGITSFPIENGEMAIRQILWKITDDNYNKAKAEYNF